MTYTSASVLNPQLYSALNRNLGVLGVVKLGQRNSYSQATKWFNERPSRTRQLQVWGEAYKCKCPFCPDQSGHLHVNHEWATGSQALGSVPGNSNLGLATCHRTNCLKGRMDRRQELYRRVFPLFHVQTPAQPTFAPVTIPAPWQPPLLPRSYLTLLEASNEHPGVQYVLGRGFDPRELVHDWGVGVVGPGFHAIPGFGACLYIPFFALQPRVFVGAPATLHIIGWQARTWMPANKPKYLTAPGFPKGQYLYGAQHLDWLPTNYPAVLVEGVTDAWRYGPGAIALLGNSATADQLRLLAQIARQRPLVVMLDQDATAQSQMLTAQLWEATRQTISVAPVPSSYSDPGACLREQLRQAVDTAMGHRQPHGQTIHTPIVSY